MGRLEWAEEEFGLLTAVRWAPPDADEPAFLRMKGAKALDGRGLAVLRELFQWRDQLAQRTDRAAFRILNNEPMLSMAKSPPADLAALKAVRGIGPEQAERRGRDILDAVRRGLAIPEHELPRIPRPPRRPQDPAFEARLERLKALRNQLAIRYDLAPGVLCANGTLEIIARVNPATLEEMGNIRELRRWQLKEIGPDLLAGLQKPAA
jgi:ribonuclease D